MPYHTHTTVLLPQIYHVTHPFPISLLSAHGTPYGRASARSQHGSVPGRAHKDDDDVACALCPPVYLLKTCGWLHSLHSSWATVYRDLSRICIALARRMA